MTTPLGWKCGDCGLVLAPHVNEHRCDPPSGGVAVRPVVAPYTPSTGVTLGGGGGGTFVVTGGTYASTIAASGGSGAPGTQDWLSCPPWPPDVSWGGRAA